MPKNVKTKNNPRGLKKNLIFIFFDVIILSLFVAAVFPKKRPMNNRLRMFVLYKVWPIVSLSVWFPMVVSIVMKLLQHARNKNWDSVLDTVPMFIVGCFALYSIFVMQVTANDVIHSIDLMKHNFSTIHEINSYDVLIIYIFWFVVLCAFPLFVGGCIYYGEVLVPMWLPFIDNDKELTTGAFYFIWIYQSGAAMYIVCSIALWGPFLVVSTVCVCKEIDILIKSLENFKFIQQRFYISDYYGIARPTVDPLEMILPWSTLCSTGEETKQFVKSFVKHHLIIKRTIDHISRIHNYIFLVQTILLVIHSCVLTFHVYHTKHQERVLIKSTPILFASYFMMFLYCWNGQRLIDKCEELFRALYHCPWYNCPRSFKTSLSIMMEVFYIPIQLTGGGIFTAYLATFLNCVQQSVSYILILKELTPQGEQ